MKILLACYSRSGHTARLADAIGAELKSRGHDVIRETIKVREEQSKWRLALPLLGTLPVLPIFLMIPSFREWWYCRYRQAELDILPLAFPDVSGFDRVCIGGPKWLYIAYPVARYLRQLNGMEGKDIGAFATFCGPPLKVFELDMLFCPLKARVDERRGRLVTTMAVSSHYHEFFFFNEMEYVFRLLSRLCFKRALASFTMDSPWGQNALRRFCSELLTENRLFDRTQDLAPEN